MPAMYEKIEAQTKTGVGSVGADRLPDQPNAYKEHLVATEHTRGLDTRPAIAIELPIGDGFRLTDLRAFLAVAEFAGMTDDESFELDFDTDNPYEVTGLRYAGRS